MKLLKNFKFEILKNKYGKYLLLGSFAFFFIKGLIWLGIFIDVGLGIAILFKLRQLPTKSFEQNLLPQKQSVIV